MSENSYKSIRNATIAAVIAGIILLAVPLLREYVLKFVSWFWSGVIWCWSSLFDSYSLPGWAWLIIMSLAVIGLINLYIAFRGEAEEPEFKSYVEDTIHALKWRWRWDGSDISNLWCYCPRCDATLVYDDSSCTSFHNYISKTDFICENCGQNVVGTINGGNKNYAISAVKREISRRIRTNEYQKH